MDTYIGIDGCKAGWFWVALSCNGHWSTGLYRSELELADVITASERALIDIPIGLKNGKDYKRPCDLQARTLLGPRRSSIFHPPVRQALNAGSHAELTRINKQITGDGISIQTWHIVPKIKAIDKLLCERVDLRSILKEAHPELCLYFYNNRRVMKYSKKTQRGIEERLQVLAKRLDYMNLILHLSLKVYRRSEVSKDDIVDAMVLALAARDSRMGMRSLPEVAESDCTGLPMSISYI